jgi:hypothetical protein
MLQNDITIMEANEIEVFKTNIAKKRDATVVLKTLTLLYPYLRCTFDLDDCDRILRVEGNNMDKQHIITTLQKLGFEGAILE